MKYDRHENVRMGDLVITSGVGAFSDKIGIVLEPTSSDKNWETWTVVRLFPPLKLTNGDLCFRYVEITRIA